MLRELFLAPALQTSGVSWEDPPHFDPGTTFAPELADYSSVYPENGLYAREPWNQTHVDMLMYIMHHFPGNTVKSWKRQVTFWQPQ